MRVRIIEDEYYPYYYAEQALYGADGPDICEMKEEDFYMFKRLEENFRYWQKGLAEFRKRIK